MSDARPAGLDDALDRMVRALAGMSQQEKGMTMGWLEGLSSDATAPPPVRTFAQASHTLLGQALMLATSPDEPGYTANAAEAERLLRRMRENRQRVDRLANGDLG